jgi:hypothetical protein
MQVNTGVVEFRVHKSRSGAVTPCINKSIFHMSEKHSQEILILTLVSTPKKYIIMVKQSHYRPGVVQIVLGN